MATFLHAITGIFIAFECQDSDFIDLGFHLKIFPDDHNGDRWEFSQTVDRTVGFSW